MKKRIGAFLCALLLAFNLATTAPRARAVSAALAAAGVGVVLGAALCAAGIYPYKAAESFGEWTSDKLSSLWSQFCESTEGIAAGATVAMYTSGGLKGYLMNSTIIMPYAVYNVVAAFTSWVASHFALTDNQTGVELGTVESGFANMAVCGYNPTNRELVQAGHVFGNGLYYAVYDFPNSGRFPCYVASAYNSSGQLGTYFISKSSYQYYYTSTQIANSNPSSIAYHSSMSLASFQHDNTSYSYYYEAVGYEQGFLEFSSFKEMGMALYGFSEVESSFSGITADTGTVEPLAPLAEGTEYGGLAVAGATPMETPADVIEQGITDREKPVVRPVEVDLEGVEVDNETGELTENPVVVTPDVAIPGIQDLTVPQTFLDKLETAMRTKFPFCLPFDFMRFITALNMTPEAPRFSLTFHDPFTDSDYTITVDLAPWDGVAALVRQLESVLLLLGFWFNFDKFNLLNIILGQLG